MLTLTETLLVEEAAPRSAIARALLVSVTRDVPFVRALLDTGAMTEEALSRYLERSSAPSVQNVAASLDLVARLPEGLCARLLAVPLRVDPLTGTVDVAVADADDPHPLREIGFHLGTPVRAVRATVSAIERALDEFLPRDRSPFVGRTTRDLGSWAPARPSGLRSFTTSFRPPSNTPPWGTPVHPAMAQAASEPPWVGSGPSLRVPPLGERRFGSISGGTQRPPPLRRSDSPADDGYAIDPESLRPIVEVRSESRWGTAKTRILETLRAATSRDEVLELLLAGAHELASRVALFVVKRDGYVGWTCTPEFGDKIALRSLLVPYDVPSVFDHAVRDRIYLGPVAHEEGHVALLLVMRHATRDVAVIAVRVSGRPAVIVMADELGDTMLATQRLEELALVAGQSLTRILRTRR